MRRYVILLLLFFSFYLFSGCALEQKNLYKEDDPDLSVPLTIPALPEQEDEIMEIIVEIKGAVLKPGVYQMKGDSRLHDLFQLAGGGTDTSELRSVNLAMRIEDGQSFYIPEKGEDINLPLSDTSGGQEKEKKINLNTATKEELMTVTGIGPSTADNILAYREETGRFSSVDDLLQVSRIGEKTLDKIRDYFTVK